MRRFLAVIALLALVSLFALGQVDTGQVAGTITDPSGAVVSNATVKFHNRNTGFERSVVTSGSGAYTATNLIPGPYELTVTAQGFAEFKQAMEVTVGGRETADIKLTLASTSQTVQVEAGTAAVEVNTQDSQISAVIDPQQVINLPSLTRNPYDFVVLTGNVNTDPNGSTGANGVQVGQMNVGVSLNGSRSASTDILLDGVENVDLFSANVGQQIPLDSVQEFRVVTSGFDANYGRATGGVVNLETKSGTNSFHGSLYEFNRVSALASNTEFEDATNQALIAQGAAPNPKDFFVRNQFGYSIGGPVIKNKLFFFSNTEWTRIRSNGLQQDMIPTQAFLAASSPATQAFFNTYGKNLVKGATLGATDTPAGWVGPAPLQQVNYTIPANDGAGNPENTYSTLERVDFNISDKTTFSGRYGLYNESDFVGTNAFSPYDGYNTGFANKNQNLLLSLSHVFSQSLVSSTKISYNRLNNEQPLGTAPVSPTLYLNHSNTASVDPNTNLDIAFPGYLPFSPGNAIPFGGPQNLYQFSEDLNWNRGKHSWQFGGSYILIKDNRIFGAYENAIEEVTTNSDFVTALQDLQAGNLHLFQAAVNPQGKLPCREDFASGTLIQTPSCTLNLPVSAPSFERNNIFNDLNFYGQDTWKVTPRLTATLGIRWEYYGVQHNANPNLESNFFLGSGSNLQQQIANGQVATSPNSPVGGLYGKKYHNFAPRLGVAWDPTGTGKTSVRAGFGIAYERDFGNVTYNVIQNPPNYGVISIINANTAPGVITTSNAGPLAGTGTKALPPVTLRAPFQQIPVAYAELYNASIQHQLFTNTLLSVEYSGLRGVHQYSIYNENELGMGNVLLGSTIANGGLGVPLNTQYSSINARGANGDAYYNALNFRVEANRFAQEGLQLNANYTYSHAIDNLSSTFSQSGNNFNLGYLDPFNPGLDRGNADYDIRHHFVLGAIYQPKFMESSSSALMRNLLGGFQFAPILNMRTGTPFTIYDCSGALVYACPNIVNAPGLVFKGNAVANGGIDSYDYIPIPAASQNLYADPLLGRADLPTCNGSNCTIPIGLQRNSWWSPAFWDMDLGVYKNFKVKERYQIQLRSEFYNVFNHHNMYIVPGNADFAEVSAVQALKGTPGGNPGPLDERRNVQLAIRFQF